MENFKVDSDFGTEQGIRHNGDVLMYNMGDLHIFAEKREAQRGGDSMLSLQEHSDYKKEELIRMAKEFMELIPGVSDILFYYALLTIVHYFIIEVDKSTIEMIIVVTGKRGHFKTLLSKMVVAVTKSDLHEVKFFSTRNCEQLGRILKEMEGFNVLIDDIFPVSTSYKKQKQRDLLNVLSRYSERMRCNTGIIITAEHMPQEIIASGYDRMLELKISNMTSKEKETVWEKYHNLPDDFMAAVFEGYASALMQNFDQVRVSIKEYLKKYALPRGLSFDTRMGVHVRYLQLSEYLYRKFWCDGNENDSCMKTYCENLYQTAMRQQNKVLMVERSQQEVDYIKETYNVITNGTNYLVPCFSNQEYKPTGNNYFLTNDKIIITPSALMNALRKKLYINPSKNKLMKQLGDAGILEKEGGINTKSTKYGGRHLYICLEQLENYVKIQGTDVEEDIIVPVVRKGRQEQK